MYFQVQGSNESSAVSGVSCVLEAVGGLTVTEAASRERPSEELTPAPALPPSLPPAAWRKLVSRSGTSTDTTPLSTPLLSIDDTNINGQLLISRYKSACDPMTWDPGVDLNDVNMYVTKLIPLNDVGPDITRSD